MLNKLTRTIGCLAAAMLLAVPEAMTAQKIRRTK